ncbi:MAG: sulfatase-like hydrolase/transferase [Phycisphaerae bacterium]|nr:sulfatase-like hydrolase/transferase [Phycisphaerae bacterium]
MKTDRRTFLKACGVFVAGISTGGSSVLVKSKKSRRPNVILFMTDDQGWGDVGFNGNDDIVTPNLDRLAAKGANLYHFFSGCPVCSPTRATVLTGRHYFRYGIWTANTGRLPREEYTIPNALQEKGYATGHFGKWHLGSPHPDYTGKGGGESDKHLARPEWFGYDKHFVTHHAVSTWDPYGPGGSEAETTDNPYWEDGQRVTEKLTGCDTRIIMDRVIPFIETAAENDKPFFTVIWSHAPHTPIQAGPKYRKMYEDRGLDDKKINYYGSITALDDQVGRLDAKLKELGVWDNTMFWYCSDNGPAKHTRDGGYGSTDGMRGKKAQLFNGGVCVPAFLVWPGKVKSGQTIKTPLSTLDYLPTVFAAAGASVPDKRPIDGENIIDIVTGKRSERKKTIPFRFRESQAPELSLLKGKYRYYTNFDTEESEGDMLFDFFGNRGEDVNIIKEKPAIAAAMRKEAIEFIRSCENSYYGNDYPEGNSYEPMGPWHKMKNRPLSSPDERGKKDKKDKKERARKKARKREK